MSMPFGVPPVPNGVPPTHVTPQRIAQAPEVIIFWPAEDGDGLTRFSPEMIAANIGHRVKMKYGGPGEFSYEAEVTAIVPKPDGSGADVTLRRIKEESSDD